MFPLLGERGTELISLMEVIPYPQDNGANWADGV